MQQLCWRRMIGMKTYGNLLSPVTKVTRDRDVQISTVTLVMRWIEDLLNVDYRTHDNWFASFQTWRRPSLFSGRAQTCRDQSNVWNSRKLLCVTLKLKTKIFRSDWCPGEPHQRSPNAPIFEDWLQEETEWQEQGAREAAWRLARNRVKSKGASKSSILFTFGK